MKKIIALTAFISLIAYSVSAQTRIAAKDAAKHLNQTVTIADKVYSTKLIENTNMVLLDLGGEHPNHTLPWLSKARTAPSSMANLRNIIREGM